MQVADAWQIKAGQGMLVQNPNLLVVILLQRPDIGDLNHTPFADNAHAVTQALHLAQEMG